MVIQLMNAGQVAASLAEAKESAAKALQESLVEQDSTIRQECQDHEEAALKTLTDQLSAEQQRALESQEQQNKQSVAELTQKLSTAQETALAEQEQTLAATHSAEVTALEVLRAQDQAAAKEATVIALPIRKK